MKPKKIGALASAMKMKKQVVKIRAIHRSWYQVARIVLQGFSVPNEENWGGNVKFRARQLEGKVKDGDKRKKEEETQTHEGTTMCCLW